MAQTIHVILLQLLHYVEECRLIMNWVDLLDIACIGALVSIASVWLRRRAARAILFALVPLLVTYAAARDLKMYMTSMLFQFGLIALFVSIVVIFQEDFRRAFESLAVWRPWGRRRSLQPARLTDLLVEALTKLAADKTGALIVLQGRQSIDPHIRHGIPLHGTVSTPLLLSIFDPHSPGHDGGITIVEGRVNSFGVHLPLSRDAKGTGRLGTRHAAALGLAEKCDALVLVVSEEQGTTSLAQDGKIRTYKSARETRGEILDHCQRISSAAVHRSLWEIPWARLTASFLLSLVLWFVFARPANLILRTVEATIVYRALPVGWEARAPDPAKVKLTLFGPEGPLMQLDPTTLAISVDLLRVAEGQQRFVLSDGDIHLPPRVRVKRIEPPEVAVQAYTTRDVEVPVHLNWLNSEGRMPNADRLQIAPAKVVVKIPRESTPPGQVETEPIDARELRGSTRLRVKLRAPSGTELSTVEADVSLTGQ